MSDSEDEVQSRTVKITVVGEPSTGKVSKIFIYSFILFHTKIVQPFVDCKFHVLMFYYIHFYVLYAAKRDK